MKCNSRQTLYSQYAITKQFPNNFLSMFSITKYAVMNYKSENANKAYVTIADQRFINVLSVALNYLRRCDVARLGSSPSLFTLYMVRWTEKVTLSLTLFRSIGPYRETDLIQVHHLNVLFFQAILNYISHYQVYS